MKKYTALAAALAAAALAGALAPRPALADEFPQLSDEQMGAVQRRLAVAYTHNRVSSDPVLQQYVLELNERLDANPRTHVTFVRDGSLNAYAAWGNVIVINSGLLSFTQSEDEIVAVLAHEHAHISQEHFHRLPEEASLVRGVATAGFLVALLAGNTDAANAFAGASGLAANQELAALREFEREADNIAVRTMVRAGYDPGGFVDLLGRMGKPGESADLEYLRTHPVTENRVSELAGFIRSQGSGGAGRPADGLSYWLVRERSNWLTERSGGTEPPGPVAGAVRDYGALIRGRTGAAAAAERLSGLAGNWIVALALAEHRIAAGEAGAALELMEEARRSDPDNVALASGHLHALAEAKDRTKAVKAIAKMSSGLRNSWDVAHAEARLWSELGDEYNYRLAVGFSQYSAGNLKSAESQVARLKSLGDDLSSATKRSRMLLLEGKIKALMSLTESG